MNKNTNNKKVFAEAVSQMKQFLLGSALVLTLVAVVPALAQESATTLPPSEDKSITEQPSGRNKEPRLFPSAEKDTVQSPEKDEKTEDVLPVKMKNTEKRADSILVIPKLDFSDLNDSTDTSVDLPASMVSSLNDQAISPVLDLIDSGKVTNRKLVRTVVLKVSRAVLTTSAVKQVCNSFEDRVDARECLSVFKSFRKELHKAKTSEDLTDTLETFRDDLMELSGSLDTSSELDTLDF